MPQKQNAKFARSVRNKTDFINDYFVDHHLDIIALTETRLSHDKADINALTADGYNLRHLKRKNIGGGGCTNQQVT